VVPHRSLGAGSSSHPSQHGLALWSAGLALLGTLLLISPLACGRDSSKTPDEGRVRVTERDPIPDFTSALPGAASYDADLVQRLRAAWTARGEGYVPHTRHLRPDGTPLYTNRLFLESSPYLRQHAHNPVNWYPWGDEAFETARRLGRPVLLSIGYSTCHWCHVMEEESFEDEGIAGELNRNYVAIKVDREERPDVDAIYMNAVQMLTGGGGWPMTVWLTPDRKPFYGGTYFPARDGDHGAALGFLSLLKRLREIYDTQPDRVAESSTQITRAIEQNLASSVASQNVPGVEPLHLAFRQAEASYDSVDGGRQGAPKFPSSLPIRFLLRYHRRTGNPNALHMATQTLEKMAHGGLYDQIGGGFHRYSTDSHWLVPHFEKMLYDNALLVPAYLEAYQVTGRADFARVAREVLGYVDREMTAPEGGFFAATDADSPTPSGGREEGWFFTWTPAEIEGVLDAGQARIVEAYYGVTVPGNFEGRNILHVDRPLEDVARELGVPIQEARKSVEKSRKQLYEARRQRPAPHRDEKIVTAWNGLMISAFARGALVLGDETLAVRAANAADFVLRNLRRDGRLLRSYTAGHASLNAYLDDYAFLIAGLLDLYEASGELRWLREAVALEGVLESHYEDPVGGGFFATSDDHEVLLAREKPADDGAEPCGNSVEALNLLRLHEFTGRQADRERAEGTLRALGDRLSRAPLALSEMLLALDFFHDRPFEIAIVTPRSLDEASPLLDVLRGTFVPNRVLARAVEGPRLHDLSALAPWVEGKKAQEGRTTVYVCEWGVCQLPTADAQTFSGLIRRVERLPDTSDAGVSR
jgi:uncharacterized protein